MQLVEVPNCPVDGAAGTVRYADVQDAYFGTQGHWHYRQHKKTGHLWLDPRPADPTIGDLYTNYYTHATELPAATTGLWRQAIALALSIRLGYPAPEKTSMLAKLISHFPSVGDAAELEVMRIQASESGRMLDVGCGGGAFLCRMRKAGWVVAGIEPDVKAAARLVAQEGFPVYRSLEELTQKEEQPFDIIVLSHVIEHLPNPMHTLTLLRSLLAAGGRLLLTTPNALSLGSRIFGASWRGLEPPRHFNVFSPDSLCQALSHADLSVVCVRTDVRLARGIWFLSYLARAGKHEIEITQPAAHRLLKLTGYIFQLFEAGAVKLLPNSGEEIFCVAKARYHTGADNK
ncbi:MAG: class I SAM-dependent methyltransferase [Thiobacillaceae bacterium]